MISDEKRREVAARMREIMRLYPDGCSWVHPVRAFTDHCKASVCRYIREQRREKPRDGVSCPIDYIGSCVKRIEVVIDE